MFLLALLLGSLPLLAQARRDPLTKAEADQIRETAPEPNDRLKLYVTFAKSRMLAVDHLQADPRFAAARGDAIHDLVEQFQMIMDELNRNIDQYADRHQDMRKGLKVVVEATSDFQLRLRALKEMEPANEQLRQEKAHYQFIVDDATEANNDVADNARKTLDEQNEEFKSKKEKDKEKKKSDKDQ
jgi:methyl-accepting chemotaxis protein